MRLLERPIMQWLVAICVVVAVIVGPAPVKLALNVEKDVHKVTLVDGVYRSVE